MTHKDYEEQKRRLAEQHRALLEMVETAHQLQLRALDIVWRMMSGEAAADSLLPPAAPPQPAAPPTPPARRRQRAWELHNDIVEALPQLPDPFVHSDVCRAIGYAPDRGSVYRTLQDLRQQGYISVLSGGTGNQPTRYRKTSMATGGAEP
jgi:hypothetical protein